MGVRVGIVGEALVRLGGVGLVSAITLFGATFGTGVHVRHVRVILVCTLFGRWVIGVVVDVVVVIGSF